MNATPIKRIIVLGPILSCLAYIIPRAIIGKGDPTLLYQIEGVSIEVIAGAACVAAGLSFARREHLRAAWIVYGIGFWALVCSATFNPTHLSHLQTVLRVVMTFIANATGVWALWLFARTSRIAGLELPGTRQQRIAVMIVGFAVAIVSAGPPVLFGIEEVIQSGRLRSFVAIFSSSGDIISFSLLVPLIMTGYALRGGRLATVWFLLAAGVLGWLLLDAQDTIGLFFHAHTDDNPEWVRAITEPFRILGCFLTVSSALQQILLAREARATSVAASVEAT